MPVDIREDRILRKMERRAASEAALRAEKARVRPTTHLPEEQNYHDQLATPPDIKFSLKPNMSAVGNTTRPRKLNVLKRGPAMASMDEL